MEHHRSQRSNRGGTYYQWHFIYCCEAWRIVKPENYSVLGLSWNQVWMGGSHKVERGHVSISNLWGRPDQHQIWGPPPSGTSVISKGGCNWGGVGILVWCGVPEGEGGGMDEIIFVSNDCVFIQHFMLVTKFFWKLLLYLRQKSIRKSFFFVFGWVRFFLKKKYRFWVVNHTGGRLWAVNCTGWSLLVHFIFLRVGERLLRDCLYVYPCKAGERWSLGLPPSENFGSFPRSFAEWEFWFGRFLRVKYNQGFIYGVMEWRVFWTWMCSGATPPPTGFAFGVVEMANKWRVEIFITMQGSEENFNLRSVGDGNPGCKNFILPLHFWGDNQGDLGESVCVCVAMMKHLFWCNTCSSRTFDGPPGGP